MKESIFVVFIMSMVFLIAIPNISATSDIEGTHITTPQLSTTSLSANSASIASITSNTTSSLTNVAVTGTCSVAGSSCVTNATLPLNPSTELTTSRQETIVTNFGKGHGWTDQTVSACTQTDDKSDFVLGNQSLSLTMIQNTGSACITRSSAISPALNFTNKIVVMWVKFNDTVNPSDVRLIVTNDGYTDFQNYYMWGGSISSTNYFTPNVWYKIAMSPTESLATGTPNLSAINGMQFRVQTTNGHAVNVHINAVALEPVYDYPIISFTFDDGFNDQYETAKPLLDKYHYPATAFVITNNIGSNNAIYMTLAQLHGLQEYSDWDISAHTLTHPDLTHLSQQQLINELHDSKLWLIQNGFSKGADYMAYPFGAFNKTVIDQEAHYYKMARTISETPVSSGIGMREVIPPADPLRLRVVDWTNTLPVSTIENAIDKSIANHDWVIFELHHVVNSSATSSTQITAANFTTVLDYIHNKSPTVRVMTLSQVEADFSPNPASPSITGPNTWTGSNNFTASTVTFGSSIIGNGKYFVFPSASTTPAGLNITNTFTQKLTDTNTNALVLGTTSTTQQLDVQNNINASNLYLQKTGRPFICTEGDGLKGCFSIFPQDNVGGKFDFFFFNKTGNPIPTVLKFGGFGNFYNLKTDVGVNGFLGVGINPESPLSTATGHIELNASIIQQPMADPTTANSLWRSSTNTDVYKYRDAAGANTYSFLSTKGAVTTATPSNPSGTTSTTAVMMGLAGSLTPAISTRMDVTICGQMANSVINDGTTVQLRYGTSTAPTNGAALTGTQLGASQTFTALVAAQKDGFCVTGIATGLSIGTAYWIDAAVNSVTGGTSTITGITIKASEV